MKLSIIIPCYNEGEVLPLTLERFNALSHEWLAREDCTEVEFVLVDDGSQDKTQELLVEASKLEKHFKIIRFSFATAISIYFLPAPIFLEATVFLRGLTSPSS